MFEVSKPRQFHYEPRFYDPEKEKWEAVKKKYAVDEGPEADSAQPSADSGQPSAGDEDLEYFERKVREIDRKRMQESHKLTVKDLFRKRAMPTFHYQPRFADGGGETGEALPAVDPTLAEKYRAHKHSIKIHRRFDISDSDYMKPAPSSRILLYGVIVFLLLMLIVWF